MIEDQSVTNQLRRQERASRLTYPTDYVTGLHHEIARLRDALLFYAEGGHYWLNQYHEPRIKDLGEYAKKALGRDA